MPKIPNFDHSVPCPPSPTPLSIIVIITNQKKGIVVLASNAPWFGRRPRIPRFGRLQHYSFSQLGPNDA
jgi:hypothetical protein